MFRVVNSGGGRVRFENKMHRGHYLNAQGGAKTHCQMTVLAEDTPQSHFYVDARGWNGKKWKP